MNKEYFYTEKDARYICSSFGFKEDCSYCKKDWKKCETWKIYVLRSKLLTPKDAIDRFLYSYQREKE